MDDFFDKANSENWSFANYLAKTGARTSEDFNKAKLEYILELLKMQRSKDYKDHKRAIGQLLTSTNDIKFEPAKPNNSTNIHIKGDVVSSIVGSPSSILKINNDRKRRALRLEEQDIKPAEGSRGVKHDEDIFYEIKPEDDIWNLWVRFFQECKQNEDMHEFSLEKVGIIQCEYKVKMRSCLVEELYTHLSTAPVTLNAFDDYEEGIATVFKSTDENEFKTNLKAFKNNNSQDKRALFISKLLKLIVNSAIDSKKQLWITKSEANYSEYFVWQLFKIVREEALRTTSREALVLYDCCTKLVISLNMVQVTPSKKSVYTLYKRLEIRLWSLEQASPGVCIMELMETATVPSTFGDSEIYMRDIVNLMYLYKAGLERSIATIEELKAEHNEVKLKIARRIINPASAPTLVSLIEKDCILKIKGEYIPGYQDLQVSIS